VYLSLLSCVSQHLPASVTCLLDAPKT
jgi:hypothetical protein